MCGIVAVAGRRDCRPALPPDAVLRLLTRAADLLAPLEQSAHTSLTSQLEAAAALLLEADDALRSIRGVRLLVEDASCVLEVERLLAQLDAQIASAEQAAADHPTGSQLERTNAALVELRDHAFALRRDRLRTAREITALWGGTPPAGALVGLWSIQTALSALDRLEVRGRDSAGLQVFVQGASLATPQVAGDRTASQGRLGDPLFGAGAVRDTPTGLAFAYKTASEIGELGDNTAALRAQIREDGLLRWALAEPDTETIVLGHTRWASVGIVSQPNTHPIDAGHDSGVHVAAVLNGDVDNFADLIAQRRLSIAPEITTDAKVIPTMLRQALEAGRGSHNQEPNERHDWLRQAFTDSVSSFDGSVAIAAHTSAVPEVLALALRGSGQALYVGAAGEAYVVASEPYGLVETCRTFVRLDGETLSDPANPVGSRGQVMLVARPAEGSAELTALGRFSYDGSALPISASDITSAEVSTRDIDRGDSPHFLLKEIREAPRSLRATLRGRIGTSTLRGRIGNRPDQLLEARLGPESLPEAIRAGLRSGAIRRVVAIGQGTAAAAGASLPHFAHVFQAAAVRSAGTQPPETEPRLDVSASLATEFSGFGLRPKMSDTLVVAVSQSGTTTDTNRTVELARARGAHVVAIVNRRGSDLTDRADGVLYTSDGRDVEMSVASTKAFYAQVAACALLAAALVAETRAEAQPDDDRAARAISDVLAALGELPAALEEVLAGHPEIAAAARRHVGAHRHWAVVGNGANRIASREIRIKLSEVCYHAVAEDGTEDKKHIDLSCEPLILVCATGLLSSVADDAAKEVAIYRAHKATPIVVASRGSGRFDAAADLLEVPAVHPALDFVLAAAAGHLFSYEAALAIDGLAAPLREMRAETEALLAAPADADDTPDIGASNTPDTLDALAARLAPAAERFNNGVRAGSYDGHLRVGTAARLGSVLRYATAMAPLEMYQADVGKAGRPSVVIDDLTGALNIAIDELTRPVDTIKHQAKTVTVGISRADETLLESMLVGAVLGAGTPRDQLGYAAMRTLAALDPAVAEVTGWTRYRIDGEVTSAASAEATIWLADRGGTALGLESRTVANPQLRGSKHRAAYEREVTVARGSDGRSVIHVPETKGGATVGLTLLHGRFVDTLPAGAMRAVLMGYRGRYGALADAVTETLPHFRDDLLGTLGVFELLTQPVYVLAEHWLGEASPGSQPATQ